MVDEQVRRIKEFIELLAGPKWKTFIRRREENGGQGKNELNGILDCFKGWIDSSARVVIFICGYYVFL